MYTSVVSVYTGGPVYRVSVCQCVISVPQCTLPVYVQYTLNTLEFDLGTQVQRGRGKKVHVYLSPIQSKAQSLSSVRFCRGLYMKVNDHAFGRFQDIE